MATQMQIAQNRLFGDNALGAINIKLYPGSDREISQGKMAEQINKALSQLETGDYELVNLDCE